MCITRQETWGYAGKNYHEEIHAVQAALIDIGTRFVKEHHSQPLMGLLELGADISALRARYLELRDGPVHPEKAPSENATGEPKGSGSRRLAARQRFEALESVDPVKRSAIAMMEREGYIEPRAFWTRANAAQWDELERILDRGAPPTQGSSAQRGSSEYALAVGPHSSDGLGG